MASVPTFSANGSKATTAAKLDAKVFGVETPNHELLKLAYETYLSNSRVNLAVVKTRGLVRGGGKKPWKQKGTGRARFGSSRNPIWRGGGIVFGPTGLENYTKKLSTQSKRLALRQALSVKAASGRVSIVDKLVSKEGKTSEIAQLLTKFGANRTVLIAVAEKTPELIRACSNLQKVTLVGAKYLNVYNILNADSVLLTADAQKIVEEWLMPVDKTATTTKEAK
jgi:large subunit ribosomal protein L4